MRILIVEDDFVSRKVLQRFLSPYGECDIAVDGEEGMTAFRSAMAEGEAYNLVCLDIMMPKKDGQEVLKEIRALEEERGTLSTKGVKVIMTTALDDPKTVMTSFRGLCDAFLVKPVVKEKLVDELRKLKLIE